MFLFCGSINHVYDGNTGIDQCVDGEKNLSDETVCSVIMFLSVLCVCVM